MDLVKSGEFGLSSEHTQTSNSLHGESLPQKNKLGGDGELPGDGTKAAPGVSVRTVFKEERGKR